ncbi:MAG: tetratricopeptide repeat protein [Armatimonadetes bacterium]|nr:tetratricopeptide repeat protein [Armatimonadota bacterium]
MHLRGLQKWFTLLLAVIFLCGAVFPAWAADRYDRKSKNFFREVTEIDLDQDNDMESAEQNDEEIDSEKEDKDKKRERTREHERLNKGNIDDNGLKIRLEVELEEETEAGLAEDELPGKNDRAGLEKLTEKLEAMLSAQPGNTKLLHRLAVYYRNLGEYDRAIELCKEILAADPANQSALVLMAISYRAKGDIATAIEQLQQLLAEKETVGHSVYAYLGILHEAAGNLAQAVESVEKAVYAAGTEKKEYRQKLGELYVKAGIPGLKIFIRGQKIEPDAPPFIENGRTLVPVRAVAEALGLNVQYFDNGTVVITNPTNGRTVTIYIGKTEALIGSQKTSLEASAKIKDERTFVPLRFVAQGLGAGVDYLADGQIVTVD